mmetsp:Transcript_34310/g.98807  ORF Transcript_34310/g.98807 Transcript_34310/m.98807 type:complete len:220 (+) Transcript_34310:149-808(+)
MYQSCPLWLAVCVVLRPGRLPYLLELQRRLQSDTGGPLPLVPLTPTPPHCMNLNASSTSTAERPLPLCFPLSVSGHTHTADRQSDRTRKTFMTTHWFGHVSLDKSFNYPGQHILEKPPSIHPSNVHLSGHPEKKLYRAVLRCVMVCCAAIKPATQTAIESSLVSTPSAPRSVVGVVEHAPEHLLLLVPALTLDTKRLLDELVGATTVVIVVCHVLHPVA